MYMYILQFSKPVGKHFKAVVCGGMVLWCLCVCFLSLFFLMYTVVLYIIHVLYGHDSAQEKQDMYMYMYVHTHFSYRTVSMA